MSNTIFITANWTTGALSQQTISRQYDNNRYAVQFIGYPEGDGTEELDLYLLVWMSTAPGQKPGEITPIQLNSDQWYISNYFTQQVQVIKFQLCVLNEAGTYEAHSPIFSGRIGDSLEHDGTSHDIDVSTLFDAYREYLNELIIRAGAVVIDPTLSQSGQAADAKVVGGLKTDISALPVYRYAGEIAETGAGFVSNTGVITAHNNYKYAKYNLHDGAQKITVDSMYVTGSASNYAAFAFFDSGNTLISTVNNRTINTTNVGNTFTNVEVDVPLTTDYVLITFGNMGSSTTFSTITEYGLYKPSENKRVFNNGLNSSNKQFFYFHTTASELGNYTSLAFNAKFKTVSPVLSYEVYFTGYDAEYTNRIFAIYKTGLTKGIDGNEITIAENFQDISKFLSSKTYIGVVVNFLYAYSSETGARTGISNANLYAVTSDYCMLNDTELELAHYPASGFTTLSTDYAEHYNPLYGGFLCAIGDSLTGVYYKAESETWVALIAKWNNMQYENHGVSGNPMAKPDGYTSKCMAERVDDLANTKYYSHIFVMGGANDYNENIPIGENTDTAITTFKGAINHIITTLTQKFPNARIVFATTYRRNQSYADKPYADAMLEVCKLHSIPCLNNYENSGVQFFDSNWMAIYGATNALGNNHLNAAGDLFVAPRFEHALKYGIN